MDEDDNGVSDPSDVSYILEPDQIQQINNSPPRKITEAIRIDRSVKEYSFEKL